jgi:hypothetical protein
MHPVTTGDELEVQAAEEIGVNSRYRDIFLLARVIDELEGQSPVTPAMIEELYEADFLYLQLLYREVNGDGSGADGLAAVCPHCGKPVPVRLAAVYKNMEIYRQEDAPG